MKAHLSTLKKYITLAAIILAALVFSVLAFLVVGLADLAFGWVPALLVNLAIIGLFCYGAWILRFEMYRNLRFLH